MKAKRYRFRGIRHFLPPSTPPDVAAQVVQLPRVRAVSRLLAAATSPRCSRGGRRALIERADRVLTSLQGDIDRINAALAAMEDDPTVANAEALRDAWHAIIEHELSAHRFSTAS